MSTEVRSTGHVFKRPRFAFIPQMTLGGLVGNKLALGLQVPLLLEVWPAFFGKQRASELATLPVLRQHLQRPEYVDWNALRDKVVSNYLTPALRFHAPEEILGKETGVLMKLELPRV